MTVEIIVVRDPDASNEIHVFGATDVLVVDIDAGRADLRYDDEFDEWAAGLKERADGCATVDARRLVAATVLTYAESHDHPAPAWANAIVHPQDVAS